MSRRPITRRSLLAQACALGAGTGCGLEPLPAARHDGVGFRIPGEFEPRTALWLGYDAGHEAFTVSLVAALLPHVPLKMLVRGLVEQQAAEAALRRNGLPAERVEFVQHPLALYFLRDATVFTVDGTGRLGAIDFRWTQYGQAGWCRRRFADDAARALHCEAEVDRSRDGLDRAIAALAGAEVFDTPLAMEGGGVESNGQGLLIANEALWMERNPELDRSGIERELLRLPGVRKVLWLPEGLAQDPLHRSTIVGNHVGWGTGGHTDEFVRFADPHTVLLAWPEDPEARTHPVAQLNRQRMQRCHDVLAGATGADGRALRVLKVPLPRVVERRVFLSAAADTSFSTEWSAESFAPRERRRQGDPVLQVASTSYMNFVLADGVVLLPDYVPHGTPSALQARVRTLFEQLFPGRRIAFIDAIGVNWVGGGPHCATLSQPLGRG